MTVQQTSPLRPFQSEADYVAAAHQWHLGLPFPVLPGAELDRYRALFDDGELPAPTGEPRQGRVVTTTSAFSAAAGRLLAAATGRPCTHVPAANLLAELRGMAGELVAVVGLVEEFDAAGGWPGESGAKVGVVTARSAAALACLVYRSITTAPDSGRMFVAAHARLPDAAAADTIDIGGLTEEVRGARHTVMMLRGLGKECCLGLADGIVCGRSDALDSPLPIFPVEQRLMPCLRGEGCFREDVTEAERLPGHAVNAALVVTHGCSNVAVGTNVYPHHIGLGLGLLEGTAVAVIGSMGVHIMQASAQENLVEALAEGVPVGEVTHRMAERAHPIDGWFNRFGLLGDPGLVLRPKALPAPVRRPRPDETVIADLSHLASVVLPRLERLRWMELRLDAADLRALRRQLDAAVSRLDDPGLGEVRDFLCEEVADLQLRAVEDLVDRIYSTGWDFGGPALDGMRQVDQRTERCTNCHRESAALVTLRHAIEQDLVIQTLQCRRCGDLWWSTEAGRPTISMAGPLDVDAARAHPTMLTRTVRNDGPHPATGGAGFAFNLRKAFGLPPATSSPCAVPAHGTAEFAAHLDLVRYQPKPDVHTGVFVALVSGIYVASVTMMRLS
ncbi:hypothetical protein [Alloactinosynnema sp. L-07]|uniref:hypothetical protein n=1 Tax=Alloactinosynnema sp. L-07 TaxID=1653480 RepID=UPI00065EF974|nr:hypothetical protein [Alloactinosynnema sp. L-07]CRK61885.1 hypothetical protein [Alloactinosynnema sp. L-07]